MKDDFWRLVFSFHHNFLRFTELTSGCKSLQNFRDSYERKVLEIEGRKYQPDLVIFSFFVGNDFSDDIGMDNRYQQINAKLAKRDNFPVWLYQFKTVSFIRNITTLIAHAKSLPEGKPKLVPPQNSKTDVLNQSVADILYPVVRKKLFD